MCVKVFCCASVSVLRKCIISLFSVLYFELESTNFSALLSTCIKVFLLILSAKFSSIQYRNQSGSKIEHA